MLSEKVIRRKDVVYMGPEDRKHHPNLYSKTQLKEMGLKPISEKDYQGFVIRRSYYNYPLYDINKTEALE